MLGISVAPFLFSCDLHFFTLMNRVVEESHMGLVLYFDAVSNYITAHLPCSDINIRCKNASDRSYISAVGQLSASLSGIVEVVENICTVINVFLSVLLIDTFNGSIEPVRLPCYLRFSLKVDIDDQCLIVLVLSVNKIYALYIKCSISLCIIDRKIQYIST